MHCWILSKCVHEMMSRRTWGAEQSTLCSMDTHIHTHSSCFKHNFFSITVQWQVVNLSARGQKLGAGRKILTLFWQLGTYSSVLLPSNTFEIQYFSILLPFSLNLCCKNYRVLIVILLWRIWQKTVLVQTLRLQYDHSFQGCRKSFLIQHGHFLASCDY